MKTNKHKCAELEESKKHKQDSVEFELKISGEKFPDLFLLRFFLVTLVPGSGEQGIIVKQTKNSTYFDKRTGFVGYVSRRSRNRVSKQEPKEKTGKQRQQNSAAYTQGSRANRELMSI